MFESRLEKKEISVEGLDSDTVHAYGDPDLMGQVIYNLVENAVKFVNTKGTITFTFLEEPESTVFAIRNTGAGIDRDDLPKIFDRFYKTDASRSADKTGLGLGLDITRHIIRLHQGQISVSSEKNEFTEFRIQIPKEKAVERAKKLHSSRRNPPRKQIIFHMYGHRQRLFASKRNRCLYVFR